MNITYTAILDESFEKCSWVRFVATSASSTAVHGTLEQLLAEAAGVKLLLVLPAVSVTLMSVQLAAKSDKTFAAALPYALEEELAEDVDELHFSILQPIVDGRTNIAVIAKVAMQKLFDKLSHVNFAELHLLPETLLLPCNPDAWSLMLTDDACVMRTGRCSGYGFDRVNLEPLLTAVADSQDRHDAMPVDVFDCRSLVQPLPALDGFAWQQQNCHYADWATDRIVLYYQHWADTRERAHSLLQGHFKILQEVEGGQRNWLTAAAIAAVSLLLLAVSNGVENHRLQTQLEQLESHLGAVYSQAFPGEPVADRPLSEMRKRLADLKLKRGAGDQRFIDYLALTGPYLQQLPVGTIESLRFANRILEIDIRTSSIDALEALQQQLRKSALDIDLKAISSEAGVVRGRLVVMEQKT